MSWQNTRIATLAAQGGLCAGVACSAPARDVVKVGDTHVAYCRSCRLKHDAPTRLPKAVRTRRAWQAWTSRQRVLILIG